MFTRRAVVSCLVLAVLSLAGWSVWYFRGRWSGEYLSSHAVELRDRGIAAREAARARWPDYPSARQSVELRRQELARRWQQASAGDKPAILRESGAAFAAAIGGTLAPFWYGTKWDFNGITETPQEGTIACGYFVSTLLKHSGLNIERVRLAQQASLHIILTLTAAPHLHKGHGMPLDAFVSKIKALGPGMSIVGLDNHVGYLWHDGEELWFLHSTVADTGDVIKERAADSRVLGDSKYRIAGQITADTALMESWLTGRALRTYRPPPRQPL